MPFIDFDKVASIGRSGFQTPELEVLYTTADEIGPKVIVEVGAGYGTSSIVLATVAKRQNGRLYSIEFKEDKQPVWQANLQRFGVSQYAHFMLGKTPWVDWSSLPFASIDFLLIDGLHSYIPILTDFYSWGCLVRKGGRIAFHDYCWAERVKIKGRFVKSLEVRKAVDMIEGIYSMRRVAVEKSGYGLIVFEKVGYPGKPTNDRWW